MSESTAINVFLRFAAVGGSATLLQYLLLIGFVEILGMYSVAASALSFGLSACFNYWLNYHFTFASRKSHLETAPKFALTTTIGLAINTLCFAFLVAILPHYLLAQAGATATALLSNFLLHKYWIYRG